MQSTRVATTGRSAFTSSVLLRRLRRRSAGDIVLDVAVYVMLSVVVVATVYPFYYILINSLNEGLDSTRGGVYLLPRRFTWENYQQFFTDNRWTNALLITIARTLIGTAISVFFTCLVAYGLSKNRLMFRKFYFALVIIAMYVSGGLIPYYVVLRHLSLLDKFLVYVIPPALNVFFVLVAVSFFREIPTDILESGYLDGASELQVFARLALPISMPLIATMLLFLGVQHWNSWLDSAYFVRRDVLRTLPYRMMEVIQQSMAPTSLQATIYSGGNQVTSRSLQMAAMIVATFPIMCVYPFLQKHFVKGMLLGAVKG